MFDQHQSVLHLGFAYTMSASHTFSLSMFWESFERAWYDVPRSAEARSAFRSRNRSDRDQAVQRLDSLFGIAHEKLVRDIARHKTEEVRAWCSHWDAVSARCFRACGVFSNQTNGAQAATYTCAFVIFLGQAAFEAFCAHTEDYLCYSPRALRVYEVVFLPTVVQHAHYQRSKEIRR